MNGLRLAALLSGFVAAGSVAAAPASPLPAASAAPAPAATAPPAVAAAAPIRVSIDGSPVAFRGAPPQRVNGAILVPLRGVFEGLGATVVFHPETRTIEATRGKTDLIMRLGDPNAYINNAPAPLAQAPVSIEGTTMAPLRFVAEVFGATVTYLPDKNLVAIHTAQAPAHPAATRISGTLVAVDSAAVPAMITVRSMQQTLQIPVATDTLVMLQDGSQPAVQGSLSALAPGDAVDVSRSAPDGPAATILARYEELDGVVKDIVPLSDSSRLILFDNGTSIQTPMAAPITQNGAPAAWSDVAKGLRVAVRTQADHKIGYAVAIEGAPPAEAPPVPERNLSISSFQVNAAGPLKGGDTLTATLRGSAGGDAQFSIPGVVDDVPMKEQQPGVYEGSFVVPVTVNANGASVIAKLSVPGGREPVLIQAAQTVTIDSKPPLIGNRTPSPTTDVSNARPRISVTLDDGDGSGVDPGSARLFVDGEDETSRAIVTPHFATYEPNDSLANGEHRVRFVIADMVGNSAETEWRFTINARNGLVTSLDANVTPDSPHISATRPLRLTLHAQSGGHATFAVGSIVSAAPMSETTPGVYVGEYTPDRGAAAEKASVVVRFTSSAGAVIATTLDTPVTVDAAAALSPTITSPKPGEAVPGHCVIRGLSAPNATVIVTVSYKSPSLADMFKRTGTAASTQVQADETGHWHTQDLKLTSGGFFATSTGTQYTATAVVVDATGQQSTPSSVKFLQE